MINDICKKHNIVKLTYSRGGYADGEFCPRCEEEWLAKYDKEKKK